MPGQNLVQYRLGSRFLPFFIFVVVVVVVVVVLCFLLQVK